MEENDRDEFCISCGEIATEEIEEGRFSGFFYCIECFETLEVVDYEPCEDFGFFGEAGLWD